MTTPSGLPTDSANLLRVGKELDQVDSELGPLADLVGTWVGGKGWSLIAVPAGRSFQLKINPYVETLTFSPLGAPVPNRGGLVDQFISGLRYEQVIADATTNRPLHIETGMWLLLDREQQVIARQSSIPHGDVVLALGRATESSHPSISEIDSFPQAGKPPLGYLDPYLIESVRLQGVFDVRNPNQNLLQAIREQELVRTVMLDVSTRSPGAISNIPFIVEHANTTAVKSTYWIESVVDRSMSTTFLQLQYSQQIDIEFLQKFGEPGLIMWPHITINTLVKQ